MHQSSKKHTTGLPMGQSDGVISQSGSRFSNHSNLRQVDITLASTISKPTTTMITTALLNSETSYSKPLKLRRTLGNPLQYVNYCLIKVHIFALTRHGSFSVEFLQSLAKLQNRFQCGQCLSVVTFTPLSPNTQSDCVYTGSSTKIKWD